MNHVGRQRAIFIAVDYLAVSVGWLSFNVFRYATLESAYRNFHTLAEFLSYRQVILGQILVPTMMLGIFALSGFYHHPFFRSRLEDLFNTLWTTFAGMLIIYFVTLINDDIPERIAAYGVMLTLWFALFIFTFIGRFITDTYGRAKVRNGNIVFPTLICGTDQNAIKLARKLDSDLARGIKVIGHIALPGENPTISAIELPDVRRVCRDKGIVNIILPSDIINLVSTLDIFLPTGCNLLISPTATQLLSARGKLNDVTGEPLIELSSSTMSDLTASLKRASDVAVSALFLIILSPLMALIAIAVKLDSPGPVIYSQPRVGKRFRLFNILKFRSMDVDAEPNGPELSYDGDKRVTKLGRFLRKYRLDELPQLLNILKGEMSLVGPRPERPYFVEKITERMPNYSLLSQIRPGLTSWGMVKYGYADTIDGMVERMRYDILYLNNISFAVDMKIILHTVITVISGKGI